MSDNDNVVYLPGVEPPCDTEPDHAQTMITAAEFSESVQKYSADHPPKEWPCNPPSNDRYTDVNPNAIPPRYDTGSMGFPTWGVVWHKDKTGVHIYARIYTARDEWFDLPMTHKEALLRGSELINAAIGKQ